MAPSPAPRPSSTPATTTHRLLRGHTPTTTPHRLAAAPPPPPPACVLTPVAAEHPVEAVGRIREHPHPEGADKASTIQTMQNGHAVRVRTDQGYRDFSFDGVSVADSEDLQDFYLKYVETRIQFVKLGGRCTIIIYGPTGTGKSHTMFGSAKQPGIAYRALQHILSSPQAETATGNGDSPGLSLGRTKVNVTVLEVYNEEIFDLLANNISADRPKHNACRVRLEVMGKKAKNAASISGSDPDKITREIAKVEKRRIVKSTLCNERSSRSHCMVTLDVPAVGGRLVLVDMAGSENIDQAGVGVETKLQTGKINQGNIALKRVVEAIANGDSYIPFRDSKLTMLLQDSFEDDRAKILMILCASPDIRDIHKTISTLEYGAKARCIIRLPVSPVKEKLTGAEETELSILEERILAMDDYISKLQHQNRLKDREKEKIDKELMQRDQDLAKLRERIKEMDHEREESGRRKSEDPDDEIRLTLERKLSQCQHLLDEFLRSGEKKLEEHILKQQREIEWMHTRMQEIESKFQDLQEIESIEVMPRCNVLSEIREQVDVEVINKSMETCQHVARLKEKRKFGQLSLDQISDDAIESKDDNAKICKTDHECSDDHMSVDRAENAYGLTEVQTTNLFSSQVLNQAHSSNLGVFDSVVFSPAIQTDNQAEYSHPSEFGANEELSTTGSLDDFDSTVAHKEFESTRWLPVIPEESEEGEERMSDDNDGMYMDKHVEIISTANFEETDDKIMCSPNLETRSSLLSSLFSYDGKQGQSLQELKESQSISDISTTESIQSATSVAIMGRVVKPEMDEKDAFGAWSDSGREAVSMGEVDEIKEHNAALVARRSRIENIFLLCGNYRELAAHGHIKNPVQMNDFEKRLAIDENLADSESAPFQSECIDLIGKRPSKITACSTEDSKTSVSPQCSLSTSSRTGSLRHMDISPILSGFQVPSLELATSGNFAPCEIADSQKFISPKELFVADSVSTPYAFNSADMKENQVSSEWDNEKFDVYVKWETARDTSRKLIHIVRIPKKSSLAELRKAIEPHLPDAKQDFTFLMLGDPSGTPVERNKETSLQVASLPDCHNQKGSRLACLRTPFRCTSTTDPFRAIENQISSKSRFAIMQCDQNGNACGMNFKPSLKDGSYNSSMMGRIIHNSSIQTRSKVKGLRL